MPFLDSGTEDSCFCGQHEYGVLVLPDYRSTGASRKRCEFAIYLLRYKDSGPPVIPSSVQNMFGTFSDCHSLKRAPVIPENVTSLRSTFEDCWVLEGTIVINAKLPDYPQKPETIQSCFLNGGNSITLTGSCPYLQELADTATNGNVTVG